MNAMKKIFAVDDNLTNLTVIKNILKEKYETFPLQSAVKMFDLLPKVKPDLILLDVEMPDINGYDAIRWLKNSPDYKDIPVIFVTALQGENEELVGMELGAVDYIYKPFVASILLRHIQTHLELAEAKQELQSLNASTQEKLMNKMHEVANLQVSIFEMLADMVESRDSVSGLHVHRIQKYLQCLIDAMIEQGVYLDEISSWDMDYIIPSSQLHDIGKIAVSDTILNKPGKLTDEEFDKMKKHVIYGTEAITKMQELVKENRFLDYALIFAKTHHEKWNGEGYPFGIHGDAIPLLGRLMSIVDVYDALVSARPYKEPFTPEKAASIIREGSGTSFDPLLVEVFNSVEDQFKDIYMCNRDS